MINYSKKIKSDIPHLVHDLEKRHEKFVIFNVIFKLYDEILYRMQNEAQYLIVVSERK